MISHAVSYHRHRFPAEIISHAIWLYHRFCLSFRDTEDLLPSGESPCLTRRFGSGVGGSVLRTPGSSGADRDAWATCGTWTNLVDNRAEVRYIHSSRETILVDVRDVNEAGARSHFSFRHESRKGARMLGRNVAGYILVCEQRAELIASCNYIGKIRKQDNLSSFGIAS